jgi:hypothetical protein
MGIRGELFSTRVTCNGRTYFFNVKENRMGDMFLTVVESKPTETEGFERRSVVVFREDMGDFVKAFQGALSFMEKPEVPKKTLAYAPPATAGEKRSKTPVGFAGSEPEGKAAGTEEAKKRRIVVRRKKTESKDSE